MIAAPALPSSRSPRVGGGGALVRAVQALRSERAKRHAEYKKAKPENVNPWSLDQVSAQIKVDETTLRMWETGGVWPANMDAARRWAAYLGMPDLFQ